MMMAYDKNVWKCYGYWAFWVGIAFFTIYPVCNWLSSKRDHVYHLYMQSELAIPLIPQFMWIYVSLYAIFILPPLFLKEQALSKLGKEIILGTLISGMIFLLFPSVLGFERVVPSAHYKELFETIFALDLPHNMAPSLHIVYSGAILLAIFQASKKKGIKVFVTLWLLLISLSTLFVHQHHLIDIVLGYILVILLNNTIQTKGESLE